MHCVSFSPYDAEKSILASGAGDGRLAISALPGGGLIEDLLSPGPSDSSTGTEAAIHGIEWHPSAGNLLALVFLLFIFFVALHKQACSVLLRAYSLSCTFLASCSMIAQVLAS